MDRKILKISGRPSSNTKVLLILGIVFIAFNLRPSITSVGPLIDLVCHALNIPNWLAGFITTLPLIAFGILSPLTPKIAFRLGHNFTIFFGLITLTIGIFMRSIGLTITLFIGTLCLGIGIAVCNVLLPSLVKDKFPQRIGLMTSVYSTAMGFVASVASGVSVPLAEGLHYGWQAALSSWAILSIIAILIWLPQLRFHDNHQKVRVLRPSKSLWHSPLAWQVTSFMGLQAFLYYCMIAWLPEILTYHGFNASFSGWMLFVVQFVGLPASFAAPIIAGRLASQRGLVVGIGILYLSGILMLLGDNNIVLLEFSSVLLGIGQGATISLALAFIGFRTTNAQQAAELSGMAQSIGYLLAAIGPVLIGVLFDRSHFWTIPILVLVVVNLLMIFAGLGAGRNHYVSTTNLLQERVM